MMVHKLANKTGNAFLIMAVALCMPCSAQFRPPLEAGSAVEFDHYLEVEAAPDAVSTLARADAFQRAWKESLLLPRIHELRFFALQKLGRAADARAAAEEALRSAPDNLTVRAALAIQIAAEDPGVAGQHAVAVLKAVETVRATRLIPIEKYREMTARLRSQAHTALGLIRFRAGDTGRALEELEKAEQLAPFPDHALALRLGRLYASLGRNAEAKRRLDLAVRSPDKTLAEMARAALRSLSE